MVVARRSISAARQAKPSVKEAAWEHNCCVARIACTRSKYACTHADVQHDMRARTACQSIA
eukprot:364905-Chlamydomonas_euryale.AAC.25